MAIQRDLEADWRVEFIQPAVPGDSRCIMLYGREGEVVGPLTMQTAEAWMDHFDSTRYHETLAQRRSLAESRTSPCN
jgi:hypothetical protein